VCGLQDTVVYPAIFAILDFTNGRLSPGKGRQGGGGNRASLTGAITTGFCTNGDRVRYTAEVGTLYYPSFTPHWCHLAPAKPFAADIRVLPLWAEIDSSLAELMLSHIGFLVPNHMAVVFALMRPAGRQVTVP